MQLRDILKHTAYGDSIFSDSEIATLQNSITVKQVKGKDATFILCAVRNKEIRLTPEELVRQLYVRQLLHEYGYPVSRLQLEYPVHFGREVKRADIVIFDKDRPDVPYIIVELKKVKLSDGKEQLRSYCNATGAPIGVWTNGQQISRYNRKDPNYFEEITNVPKASEKLSDIINERFTYDDLKRVDKIANERRSLRSIIEEMEDEVLANAGVDSFEEIFKLLFAKLYDELVCARDNRAYLKFRNSGDTESELYDKIQELFTNAQKKWNGIFTAGAKISLTSSHLSVCVSHLQNVKLFNNNLDVIDDAFEFLMSKSQKGEKGQYFTPRYVIDMCVKMMNPQAHENIIDTAAGSSGFPVHAIFHVWRSIRTAAGLSESDLFTTEQRTQEELDFVRDHIFAIDFDEKTVRVARTLNLIAGDGQSNVIHLNTLDYPRWNQAIQKRDWRKNYTVGFERLLEIRSDETKANDTEKHIEYGEFAFDLLMANPPFAGDIKESAILTRYDLAKNEKGKWASKVGRDILFIERNLSFLKPGGRMAIVLPQGRFNNSSDKRIRDFIAERCRILAVVGLHVNVFKPHTGTKTSVLFVQKWDDELCPRRDDYPIFFATMQKPSKDNSGDKIYVKDADGEPLLDRHGHLIVDHDLYNHDGLTQDGIAEAFTQFAKRERLSFFADARPFDADYYTALMSGLEAVEVKKSKLERTMRVDSEFYSKENLRIDAVLNKLTKNSVVDLFCVSDGNHMAIADEFSDDGIRYYRGQDISNFFIEDATPIHITENTYNTPIMIRSHLQKGDVLLSIVGTIGKTALVYTEKKQTCSCKLAILRPRNSGTSEIGAVFLACKYGQNQIQKFIRGAVQMGFLLEDMNQIHIPNFSDDLCDNIAKTIGKMHNLRQKSISRYAAAETRLLSALGLQNFNPAPGAIAEKSFSESFGASGRLDAEYYQLKYEQYEYAIKSNTGGVTTVFENFTLVTNKCDRRKESYPYIEIGDINVGNGSYNYNIIETPDLPDNAKISVNPSDLIVSKVRPYRGAVAIIDDYVDDLVVSSAFCVLRPKSNYNINVLATLFRTPVYRDWFLKWNVGSSYPVIKDEDVLNMSIPILSLDVQSAISKEVQNSSALRRQSEQLLDAAKRAVEIAIEEGEEKAITWLDGEVRDCG